MPKTLSAQKKTPKTLLLTGFEAFGDDPSGQGLNPSAQVALALNGQVIGSWLVVSAVLSCVFDQAPRRLKQLIKQHKPAAMVCLGQAGGRSAISLERIAINWDEATLADNAGQLRTGQPILKTAPAAYFSTLPIHALRDALVQQNIACELSSTAGQFVCNHLFFHLMHSLRKDKKPAGFIHIPYLPEQAPTGQPSMPLETMLQGIKVVLTQLQP
jgi:pyroglutamyl-peptidase